MGLGKGGALALACLVMSGRAFAQSDSRVVLPVLVYNYAKAPADTLHSAQRHAENIFHDAGVAFEWHECRVTFSKPQKDPYCSHGFRRTDLVLKILPQSRIQAFGVKEDVAGFVPSGDKVCDAYFFYDRIRDMARSESADVAVLLGSIIAHEFGHLLMGPDSHSADGVMRAEWTYLSLAQISLRGMEFSVEQGQRIHLGALSRVRRAEVKDLAQSASAP